MGSTLIEIERIRLPGGWSGQVLTGCRGTVSNGATELRLPDLLQWRRWLGELISDPSSMPGYAVLKYSKTGEVLQGKLPVGSETIDVICKQTRLHGLRRRLAGALRASRARRNFDRAMLLLRAGINTARPLALLQHRFPRGEAWLVSEHIPDLVDLDHIALRRIAEVTAGRKHTVKCGILSAVIDLLERMKEQNLSHRDLKASNILLRHWDGDGARASAWLVDVDGLGSGGRQAGRRRQQLVRLAASLRSYEGITRTDYCRFLIRCPLHTGDTIGWKQTFRDLAHHAATYDAACQRRKTHKIDGYSGDTET